jgi:hypothetical protein
MYNLNTTPTTLGVQSWREIMSRGTRTKKVEYLCSIQLSTLQSYKLISETPPKNFSQNPLAHPNIYAFNNYPYIISWDSSVCKARALCWMAGVWFPAGARDFSLLHSIQTDSGTHQASFPMGVRRPWRQADHLHLVPMSRMVELYLSFPIRLHWVALN